MGNTITEIGSSEELGNQLTTSINAMLLLNSSCQAIIETYIEQSDYANDWCIKVSSKLNEAQKLVREWRLSGNLYFNQDILSQIVSCSQSITGSREQIEGLFKQLSYKYDAALKDEIVNNMNNLTPAINVLETSISNYSSQIRAWNDKMENVHEDLNTIIGEIQAQEVKIQDEIQLINQQISSMQQEIIADREAISKAKAEETKGICETIFGIMLAPITGGASLILAGIGVSSIAEAKEKISGLTDTINKYKNSISTHQNQLAEDQKQITSLKLILMSVGIAANDCVYIATSLDTVQITITTLKQEINDVILKISKAISADEVIMGKVWYEAFCNEWASILEVAQTLASSAPNIQHITV
ncbi:hypothetical protein [Clostridium sp. BNL1100]|uniref:alpha-pore-forming cytotoxin subunit MakE n=1 Tax=Clostridium sp. BNL1100 TaxID=755731 RepID=UPI0005A12D6C|nr:hypothetical protein [Clostridium sp. BNL1100]